MLAHGSQKITSSRIASQFILKRIAREMEGSAMETTAKVRAKREAETRTEAVVRVRQSRRSKMIKRAQIAFDGSVLDCALLDISPTGALVHLFAPADVPDITTLRLSQGESRTARRRWQRGAQVGLEFVGKASPPDSK
jgi:PilZ domain